MAFRANSSILWDYFVKDNDNKKAKCSICGDLYSYKSSTGNLKSHLKKTPKHLSKSRVNSKSSVNTATVNTVSAAVAWQCWQSSSSRPCLCITCWHLFVTCTCCTCNFIRTTAKCATAYREIRLYKENFRSTKSKIDADLMDLFIDSYQPFSLVEERAFNKFCQWIPGYELPSRKTVSQKLLPSLYENTISTVHKVITTNDLQTICLTADLWTSRANESYLAVTGHYINERFELKSILLKCANFEGSHTSDNIQRALIDITNTWSLTDKVNFVVTDNAANIQRALNDMQWKHYGCFAHTLNLIVQDSLKIVEESLNKLKRIVRLFKTSTSALEKLLKAQTRDNSTVTPKRLIQEVPTRWNSSFHMLGRCVELEQYLRATMAILRSDLPVVSNEEWQLFSDLTKILKPFDDVTKSMSGEKYMTGSLVIVMTRCLITSCEKLSLERFGEVARRVIECLKKGLETRFANVEKSPTFSTCTFLDPRYKMSVFTDPIEARNAKRRVQDTISSFITSESLPRQESGDQSTPGPITSLEPVDKFSPWTILTDIVSAKQPIGTPLSKAIKEIDTYLNEDILPVFADNGSFNCPLEWWRNHRYTYPYLARLFKQYGNVMATSVPCERIFSKTGLTVTDRRARLTSEKVSQLTFLNVNLDLSRFKL